MLNPTFKCRACGKQHGHFESLSKRCLAAVPVASMKRIQELLDAGRKVRDAMAEQRTVPRGYFR